MKIGLYFGSFNPIHLGHLIIANHMLEYSDLDQIWFVVSPQNPFKNSKSLLNEYDRLALVQLAIKDNDKFRTCDIEFSLPKPSYTTDTLTYLRANYSHEFVVLIGSDSFQNLSKWKNADYLMKNYFFKVYVRPDFPVDASTLPANIELLEAPLLEISSTFIRQSIKSGKSIHYLVPVEVEKEIDRCFYYK